MAGQATRIPSRAKLSIISGELAPARATIREVPEKSMRKARTILYPQSILDPRTPDEMFREESQAVTVAGHNARLWDNLANCPTIISRSRRFIRKCNRNPI